MSAPVVLVPGFWLGAWAWDAVAERLRADGHDVLAVTLPGLESLDADRSAVTMADHVTAVVDAIESFDAPVVLAVHSGAAAPGYGATGRVPARIAAVVYVDTFPLLGPINPAIEGAEWPLPSWQELEDDGSSLEGLSDEQREAFAARAVPEPGGAVRGVVEPVGAEARAIPSVLLCTTFPSSEFTAMIEAGSPWMSELAVLDRVEYVDHPTSHWPMWSATDVTADLIARVAAEHG